MELKITIALIIIILLVITIDLILKKKSKSTDLEKYSSELNSKRLFLKPLIISLTLIVIFSTTFYLVNKYKYNYRLTDFDDEISVLDIIKLDNYHIDNVKLVGDSIYLFENNSILNGLIYCEYGNMGILKKGKPNSKWREFYSDGQIKMEAEMKNGKQVGLRKDWYRNGQLKFQGYFKNDLQEGISKFWYNNGQIELESEFKFGFHFSNHKRWYKNGKLKSEFNSSSQTYIEFWPNGQKYCEVYNTTDAINLIPNYVDLISKPEINVFFYDKYGALMHQNYNNRYATNEWFDVNGKKCSIKQDGLYTKVDNECSIYKSRFSNGDLAIWDNNFSRLYYQENGNLLKKEVWDKTKTFPIKTFFYNRDGILDAIMELDNRGEYIDTKFFNENGDYCYNFGIGGLPSCENFKSFSSSKNEHSQRKNRFLFTVSKEFYWDKRF